MLQFQLELKEAVHDVQETLKDFAARNIGINNTAEQENLQDAWRRRTYCQD